LLEKLQTGTVGGSGMVEKGSTCKEKSAVQQGEAHAPVEDDGAEEV
jgi:hypothetical protein